MNKFIKYFKKIGIKMDINNNSKVGGPQYNPNSKSADAIEIDGIRFSPGRIAKILDATTVEEAKASKETLPVSRVYHGSMANQKKRLQLICFR